MGCWMVSAIHGDVSALKLTDFKKPTQSRSCRSCQSCDPVNSPAARCCFVTFGAGGNDLVACAAIRSTWFIGRRSVASRRFT